MKLKKAMKWLSLILIIPILILAGYNLIMDLALWQATSTFVEEFHEPKVKFISKNGDKFAAYRIIDYVKHMEPYHYPDAHAGALITLAKRYPEESEKYMAYLVASILSDDPAATNTTHINRMQLIFMLQRWTEEDFGYYKAGYLDDQIPDEAWPRIERGMRNVAVWWAKRQQQQVNISLGSLKKRSEKSRHVNMVKDIPQIPLIK